jgi:hypothetical protein
LPLHALPAPALKAVFREAKQSSCRESCSQIPRALCSAAETGSGAFLPPGSEIRDGAMVGSGSGIQDKQTKFVNSLYT